LNTRESLYHLVSVCYDTILQVYTEYHTNTWGIGRTMNIPPKSVSVVFDHSFRSTKSFHVPDHQAQNAIPLRAALNQ
jgi:hypothetical protein